jgi:hypothetical protein
VDATFDGSLAQILVRVWMDVMLVVVVFNI